MKAEFVHTLRCPACRLDGTLGLEVAASDEREVREGTLTCSACGERFAVHRGVAGLLHDPPAHILAEAAGLERFAQLLRDEGHDREAIRRLPNIEHGYWYVQARSMHQLLTTIEFQPGERLLDVGSNTCWASNHFAERGLNVVALDIATVELQGLHTAEYFIDDGHVFFERVLGSMDAIPLASESLDYVYCCQVLHHNDNASLRRAFQEAFRVLKPGGKLLVVNETLKTLRDPKGVHDELVAEYEGYEHAHWALRYRWEATRAGFHTELLEPHYRPFFGDTHLNLEPGTRPLRAIGEGVGYALRSSPAARRAYLLWLNHVYGGVSFGMIATRPLLYPGRPSGVSTPGRLARSAASALPDTPTAARWRRRRAARGSRRSAVPSG